VVQPATARTEDQFRPATGSRDYYQFLASPLVLPVVLLIAIAVFAPTAIHTWFQADDFGLVRSSELTPVDKFAVQAFDYRDLRPVPQFGFYRPLYVITFRLCFAAFSTNAVAYHVLNLALHLASVVLVWRIARRLLQTVFAANVAGAIFALHPAYTETVTYVARGNTIMVTFVYLLTTLAFFNYLDGGRWRLVYYGASVLGFAAAMLYHTTSLSLAAVLPAYVFLVAQKPSAALRPSQWLRFIPFFAIAAVMLRIQMSPEVGLQHGFKVGWHQYPAYGQYLGLSLFPVLSQDWLRLHLPGIALLSRLQMAASVAMIGATLMILERREWPYRGVFAVWWLFVALFPNTTWVLSVIPAQLYLPGASLGLVFVLAGRSVIEILPAELVRRVTPVAPLALVVLVFAGVALTLNHERRSIRAMQENRAFIANVRDTVPPLPAHSTVYVIQPPPNLVLFGDNPLDAALELYYGDLQVHSITSQEAIWIRAGNPTAVIYDNRSQSQR